VRPVPHPDSDDRELATLATVLRALGDPVRLELVRRMATHGEERCLPADLRVAKSTLSHHWRVLREAGISRTRPEGRARWMSLCRDELDSRYPGLLDAVLGPLGSPAAP
jgi:DNA-binding transcriptional ArsR family regulator